MTPLNGKYEKIECSGGVVSDPIHTWRCGESNVSKTNYSDLCGPKKEREIGISDIWRTIYMNAFMTSYAAI
jgi:hypothetical protein